MNIDENAVLRLRICGHAACRPHSQCASVCDRGQRHEANRRSQQSELGRECHRRCQQCYRERASQPPVPDQGVAPITSAVPPRRPRVSARFAVVTASGLIHSRPFPGNGGAAGVQNIRFYVIANISCPRCHSADTARARRCSMLDDIRAWWFNRWPYRCLFCGRRFYASQWYSSRVPRRHVEAEGRTLSPLAFRKGSARPVETILPAVDSRKLPLKHHPSSRQNRAR
jgi:hypothetical protein